LKFGPVDSAAESMFPGQAEENIDIALTGSRPGLSRSRSLPSEYQYPATGPSAR